jgi:hypothetical protein
LLIDPAGTKKKSAPLPKIAVSATYFNRVFRHAFGAAPSDVRVQA